MAYIDLAALPIPSTHAVYQAAIFHIQFSYDKFGTEEWDAEMKSLKLSLDKFGNRWSVGSKYHNCFHHV
jgi:hypothetical protein